MLSLIAFKGISTYYITYCAVHFQGWFSGITTLKRVKRSMAKNLCDAFAFLWPTFFIRNRKKKQINTNVECFKTFAALSIHAQYTQTLQKLKP